jgi:DNA-binding LacI/PurR family transcriptional regulator
MWIYCVVTGGLILLYYVAIATGLDFLAMLIILPVVSENICIIGCKGILYTSTGAFSIIAQPVSEIRRIASMLLVDLIGGSHDPAEQIVLRDKLIIRKSC